MKGNYFPKFLFLLICFLFFRFSVLSVQAAEIFFGVQGQEVGIEQKFEVGVFLNTQGQEINAIEGKVIFPKEVLGILEIRDGGSIIPLWIKRPSIPDAQKTGELFFSGAIPGGFVEVDGYLFSIIFIAQKTGSLTIATNNEKILLNDGLGTPAEIKKAPLVLKVGEEKKGEEYIPPYDPDPPEAFSPQIARDENVFEGRWFIVFLTQDKGSGISHYEIQETRKKQPESGRWVAGESPYVLKDQSLSSFIFVKAIDKTGNERIAFLPPQHRIPWYENTLIFGILGIILLVASVFLVKFFILWRKRRKPMI